MPSDYHASRMNEHGVLHPEPDYEPEPGEIGYPLQGDDGGCCAREPQHDGPCEWTCSTCEGTGRCPVCEGGCYCDDAVSCDYCDGSHACPHCYEGVNVDDDDW